MPNDEKLEPPDENTTSPIGKAAELLSTGTPFGEVWPGPKSPLMPDRDAREYALEVFALFISRLQFRRTGDVGGPSIPIAVPLKNIHVFQADNESNDPKAPTISFLSARATHEPYGLGPPVVEDDTADKYGEGRVLVRKGDHVEQFVVEVVGATQPERRAIVAGLKEAFRAADDSGALRLRCSSYYDRVATFRLDESEQIDDGDAGLNRRRGHLFVLLTVQEVQLVAYKKFIPLIGIDVGPP